MEASEHQESLFPELTSPSMTAGTTVAEAEETSPAFDLLTGWLFPHSELVGLAS